MMPIKAILFDKDGTLIDVNRTWIPLYREMLQAEFGGSPEDAERRLIAAGYDPVADAFESGSILGVWWPHETAQRQAEIAMRIDFEYAPRARRFLMPLFDLALHLDALKDMGFMLGVGTNDAEGSARGQIEHLGIADRFEAVIGYDSVKVPKPSGQMIQAFAQQLSCDVREIAMVGDNTHDLEEARHGGAGLAIGVLSGNGTRADLAPLADHVIDSASSLSGLLRTL
jgi:phosphoglycolate phosphatase